MNALRFHAKTMARAMILSIDTGVHVWRVQLVSNTFFPSEV